jgi:uncharacterized membrane protein YoaK (UPF0700 family)
MAVLLAACAGATDALAFFGLEGLCGHRDRQPGHGRYGIATGNLSLVRPTVTAVASSVVGEITWVRLLRRPGAAHGLLITELACSCSSWPDGWPPGHIPRASARWPC